jgi:Heavy metal binding domain
VPGAGALRFSRFSPRNFCARELLFFLSRTNDSNKNLTERKLMKLKLIAALPVVAVAFVIASAGCSKSSKESATIGDQTVAYYTCPMHPSAKSDKPGSCGICGMPLVPVYTNAPSAKP